MTSAPPQPRAASPLVALLLIALLCLIWGSTWLAIKFSLDGLQPLTSVAARVVVAALVMLAIAPVLHRYEGGAPPPTWMWVQLGIVQFTLSYSIIYVCERTLPSGLCAVLWAVFPLLMALFGHLALAGEALAPRQFVGFALGFLGIVSLFLTDVQKFGANAIPTALLLLVSPLVVALSTLAIKKHGAGVSSVLMNRNGLCLGAALLAAIAWSYERNAPMRVTATNALAVGYLAVVGTVVSFCLYFWLMRSVAAYRMSLIAYVTPALALGLGVAFKGEPVYWHTLLGAAAIIGGVAFAARRRAAR